MHVSGLSIAPHLSGQNGFHLKQSDEGSEQQNKADRLASQADNLTLREQTLASAVAPVSKSEALQNHTARNPNQIAAERQETTSPLASLEKTKKANSTGETKEAEKSGPEDPQELTEEEQKQVDELKKRDAEVRAHEQAHAAVGGSYASAPTYEFQTGPDNKQYAVGGEVQIDAAPVPNDPKATIEKMDIVIRAALAPQEPSAQDKKVAAEAQKNRSEAQAELAKQQQAELNGGEEEKDLLNPTHQSQENSEAATNNEQILSAIFAYNSASNLGSL